MHAAISTLWALAGIIAIVALVRRYWFFMAIVSSDSMLPTFASGSLLVARRVHRPSRIEGGDVLIFRSREMGVTMIKRVIGLPADQIELRSDASVRVNGETLEEQYAISRGSFRGSFSVPAGHYFFLGDNRERSEDSRSWERPYIPFSDIKGKIIFSIPRRQNLPTRLTAPPSTFTSSFDRQIS